MGGLPAYARGASLIAFNDDLAAQLGMQTGPTMPRWPNGSAVTGYRRGRA